MDAISSSETSGATQHTTRRHIPEDDTLQNKLFLDYRLRLLSEGRKLFGNVTRTVCAKIESSESLECMGFAR
jgi:hypothetical protein